MPKKPLRMTSSLETGRYGRSVKYIRCIAIPSAGLSQESFSLSNKIGRLLDLRPMPTSVEYHQFCACNRAAIALARTHRHDTVLAPPYEQRRQSCRYSQQMRQARVVHEVYPCETRRLCATLLPSLVLLGTQTAKEIAKLVRVLRVEYGSAQMFGRHHLEEVENLALGRTDSHRRDQLHLAELRGVARRHLGRNPSAERKADYVERCQSLLLDKA